MNYKSNRNREHPPRYCPACQKRCYSDKKRAAAALARTARVYGIDRDQLNRYRCSSGNGWWHVGRAKGAKKLGDGYRPQPPNERTSAQ